MLLKVYIRNFTSVKIKVRSLEIKTNPPMFEPIVCIVEDKYKKSIGKVPPYDEIYIPITIPQHDISPNTKIFYDVKTDKGVYHFHNRVERKIKNTEDNIYRVTLKFK